MRRVRNKAALRQVGGGRLSLPFFYASWSSADERPRADDDWSWHDPNSIDPDAEEPTLPPSPSAAGPTPTPAAAAAPSSFLRGVLRLASPVSMDVSASRGTGATAAAAKVEEEEEPGALTDEGREDAAKGERKSIEGGQGDGVHGGGRSARAATPSVQLVVPTGTLMWEGDSEEEEKGEEEWEQEEEVEEEEEEEGMEEEKEEGSQDERHSRPRSPPQMHRRPPTPPRRSRAYDDF